MTKCKLCGKTFRLITNTHLKTAHGLNLSDYTKRFGTKNCGFLSPHLLPKNDLRYKRWRESLKKRPPPWNKGHTKETHFSVAKISQTFRNKKIDNFARWRQEAIKKGLITVERLPLKRSGDLAELIGVILGDGYIGKFPRTEVLTISSNSNNLGFIKRYSNLIRKIFDKKASVIKRRYSNCTVISIYQKDISKRLNMPAGSRSILDIEIPEWIWDNSRYLIRCLRGLYEAEGSFCVHKPTYTYKLFFANRNKSLLKNVYFMLKKLGFHPHKDKYRVQLSQREEVYCCKELIEFRKY